MPRTVELRSTEQTLEVWVTGERPFDDGRLYSATWVGKTKSELAKSLLSFLVDDKYLTNAEKRWLVEELKKLI